MAPDDKIEPFKIALVKHIFGFAVCCRTQFKLRFFFLVRDYYAPQSRI